MDLRKSIVITNEASDELLFGIWNSVQRNQEETWELLLFFSLNSL